MVTLINYSSYMKAERDEILEKRKENIYTSATIQNEMIKLVGLSVLPNIVTELQRAPFLAFMADETTDTSNRGGRSAVCDKYLRCEQGNSRFVPYGFHCSSEC